MTTPPGRPGADGDVLAIAVRAHTIRTPTTGKTTKKRASRTAPPARARASADTCTEILVIDTETTTDPTQALVFGVWRYYRTRRGHLECVDEGLFHADDLATTNAGALGVLREVAACAVPATGPGRVGGLRLLTRAEFVEQVFFRAAYQGRARVVGFNLPFDLSRLALAAAAGRGRNRGGFSLTLSAGNTAKGFSERKHRPRLRIKHVDAHRAAIAFTKPLEAGPGHWAGDFVDLRTLTRALTGRGHSLDSACRAFGVPGKTDPGGHGHVSAEYVAYCRQDVAATADLYIAAAAELHDLGLPLTPPQVNSSASLAKATLDALGVTPLTRRMPDLDPHLLGLAMSAFYGGRAECRIRRVPVPIRLVDFTATYPTLFALLDLWPLVTAQTWEQVDATDTVRALLADVTLDDGFDPHLWPQLVGFALCQPDGDVLPVRARYDPRRPGYGIGVNPLSSTEPLWYALPDLVAAALLTGRPPRVLRAIRLVPHGQVGGLTPLQLPGGHIVDPTGEDPFRAMVEQRQRIKNDPALGTAVQDHLAQGLKINANSGAYGIWAEYNSDPMPRGETTPVTVYGRHDDPFTDQVGAPEDPGRFCCPPLAAVITAGARLLLGLIERCVTDLGGKWAMADTDSMGIVATARGGLIPCPGGPHRNRAGQPGIRALTYAQVEAIRARFTTLNPYDQSAVPGSILKHELDAWCYAIAAKRYALFRWDEHRAPRLVPASEHEPCSHGLGHLLNPTDTDSEAVDWIIELWEHHLTRELTTSDPEAPAWFGLPALARVQATSPDLIDAFDTFNHGRSYAGQVKPFNFLTYAPGAQPPAGTSPAERFRLVASYEPRPTRWHRLHWINPRHPAQTILASVDPTQPGIATLQTYATVAARYVAHTEAKALAPDGRPCRRDTIGLLRRRPVTAGTIVHIGKEANRIEDRETGMITRDDHDHHQLTYRSPQARSWADVLARLNAQPIATLAADAGVSERRLRDILKGRADPRPHLRHRLQVLADGLANPGS